MKLSRRQLTTLLFTSPDDDKRKENLYFLVEILIKPDLPALFLKLLSKRSKNNFLRVSTSSYRNTRESLGGELEQAVEMLDLGSCSHSISLSSKLPLVFL